MSIFERFGGGVSMRKCPSLLGVMKKSLDLFVEGSLFWLPITLTILLINHLSSQRTPRSAHFLELPMLNGFKLLREYVLEVFLVLLGMFILEEAIAGAYLKLGVSSFGSPPLLILCISPWWY